jgi:hypothetical protein
MYEPVFKIVSHGMLSAESVLSLRLAISNRPHSCTVKVTRYSISLVAAILLFPWGNSLRSQLVPFNLNCYVSSKHP